MGPSIPLAASSLEALAGTLLRYRVPHASSGEIQCHAL